MNFEVRPLSAGLYFVATPIGSARDITLRALDVLASADIIAAEDTRTARKLMDIHGVPLGERALVAFHDHSNDAVIRRLIGAIKEGKSVACVSEAGTPLIADPGYELGRAAIDADIAVTSVPGPSAVISALAIGGLPTDRFAFAGFLPAAQAARKTALAELKALEFTLVLYESPKRLSAMLQDAAEVIGPHRPAAVCRELTKKFEEVQRGSLQHLADAFAKRTVKGEVVVLIGRAEVGEAAEEDVEAALAKALVSMRIKDAATTVAGAFGLPRKDVYQMALRLKDDGRPE